MTKALLNCDKFNEDNKVIKKIVILLQVWFQNKRSKERRLKQLTSMGRGPFFGSSRKMRGFPMNMSPGLDDGPGGPGFPYFAAAAAAAAAAADGKFPGDFGYHSQFHEFFPGQPGSGGPSGPLPFPPQGKFTVIFNVTVILSKKCDTDHYTLDKCANVSVNLKIC
jgi:hypothetical protein